MNIKSLIQELIDSARRVHGRAADIYIPRSIYFKYFHGSQSYYRIIRPIITQWWPANSYDIPTNIHNNYEDIVIRPGDCSFSTFKGDTEFIALSYIEFLDYYEEVI